MSESLTPPVLFKCLADDTRARITLLLAGVLAANRDWLAADLARLRAGCATVCA